MAPPTGPQDEMFIDIGIYGKTPKIKEYDPERTKNKLERFSIENDEYVQISGTECLKTEYKSSVWQIYLIFCI
jgi:hypothetical protein